MKKKKLFQSVISSVILCLILSGCRHTDPVPDPDEIIFVLSLDSDDDIYAIAVEYWADEVFCGGMAASHADGSVYKRNEQSYFVFDPECFPNGEIPGAIRVSVMLSDSLKYMSIQDLADRTGFSDPCDLASIPAVPGSVVHVTVKGSFTDGFSAELS